MLLAVLGAFLSEFRIPPFHGIKLPAGRREIRTLPTGRRRILCRTSEWSLRKETRTSDINCQKKQTARTGRSDNPSGGLGRGRQSPPTLFAEITSCQLLSLSAPAPMYGDGQRLRGLSAPYAVTPKISDVAALKAIPQPLPLLLLPVGRIVWIRDKTHFVVHVETLFLPPQSAESGQLLVTLSNLLLVVGMFLPHLPHLCVPVLPHHRADNRKPLVSLHAATPFQSEGHSRPLAAHSAFWPPVP